MINTLLQENENINTAAPATFLHLPQYIKFILENKLEDFIRGQLRLSRQLNAPVLKYFEGYSEDQLLQISIEPTVQYWTYLVNNDITGQLNEALEKWKANQMPLISRDQVVAEDIVTGNYVRKTILMQFLAEYTADFKLYTELSAEIDYYLQMVISATFKTYLDIQNEKLENYNVELQKKEEQLLEAQQIAQMGSFEWSLNPENRSVVTPQVLKIFELESVTNLGDFMKNVHPDDQQNLQAAIDEAMHTGSFESEYRYHRNGKQKVIWSRGRVSFEHGKPSYLKGTVMDITERHHTIIKLTEQEAVFKQSQALAHIGNWSWNITEDTFVWSDEMYRIFGLEPQAEKITLRRFQELMHHEDRNHRIIEMEASLATGQTPDYTMRIVTPAGVTKVVKGKSRLLFNSNGEPVKMEGTCQDITNEFLLQRKLEKEKRFAESVIDADIGLFMAIDWRRNIIAFNKKYEELLGLKREDVIGKNVFEALPFLKNTVFEEDIEKGFKGIASHYPETKSVISEKYYQRYVTPLHDKTGKVNAVLSLAHDITELKQTNIHISNLNDKLARKNEQLRRSEEKYQKMVQEVKDYAILLLDKDGTILNWNQGAEKIKGYSAAEIIGKNFRLFYGKQDQESKLPERLINEALINGRATHEGWRMRKDGTYFWANVVITALHDDDHQVIGFSKVTRDLTEKRLAEEQLKKANRLLTESNNALEVKNLLLESSNKELSAFNYVASHDLQEPIRKIKTFTNWLIESATDRLLEEDKKLLQRIISSSNNMQQLIEDLLAYSYAHNNNAEDQQEISLSDLVKTIADDIITSGTGQVSINYQPLPVVKGLHFQWNQIFENIIGNSVKYARTDVPLKIEIKSSLKNGADLEQYGANRNIQYHLIEFADNGIGFDQKYATRIFEPFQRLHGKSEYSGTGIGLAICKKIVQNCQGIIYAEGKPQQGATFFVAVPVY